MFFRSKVEPDLKCGERMKLFFAAHWRGVIIIITPLILYGVFEPMDQRWHWVAACLILMAIFWVSECIPLPVTGFFPMVVFPLTGVMSTTQTCKCYMNDSLMMFLGSIMLAFSVEQSGLHKRLAYHTIKLIGFSHQRLLLAMCTVTTFVSMWITNTAATTMMIPINFAVLRVFESQGLLTVYEKNSDGEEQATDLTTCYFCAATFSATIGGIGTLVGSGTNLVFKGLFQSTYPLAPEYLSFPLFAAFGTPYMLLLEASVYVYFCIYYFGMFRPKSKQAKACVISPLGKLAVKNTIISEIKKLGKWTFWEKMVIMLFGGAMVLFFFRSPQVCVGWGDTIALHYGRDMKFIKDSALCMLILVLMCLLPSTTAFFKNCSAKHHEDLPKGRISSVLIWKTANAQMPYSFAFLLGGGFALSSAAKFSGLNDRLGETLRELKECPIELLLLIIIVLVIFVTNFASNIAVCTVFVPILMQLATEIGYNPLWFNIAAGFCASFCFMIPVGTPGNLIVQAAANVPTKKMILAGAGPTFTTIIISFIMLYGYAPVVWPILYLKSDWF